MSICIFLLCIAAGLIIAKPINAAVSALIAANMARRLSTLHAGRASLLRRQAI
jgi:hypothetical protein